MRVTAEEDAVFVVLQVVIKMPRLAVRALRLDNLDFVAETFAQPEVMLF